MCLTSSLRRVIFSPLHSLQTIGAKQVPVAAVLMLLLCLVLCPRPTRAQESHPVSGAAENVDFVNRRALLSSSEDSGPTERRYSEEFAELNSTSEAAGRIQLDSPLQPQWLPDEPHRIQMSESSLKYQAAADVSYLADTELLGPLIKLSMLEVNAKLRFQYQFSENESFSVTPHYNLRQFQFDMKLFAGAENLSLHRTGLDLEYRTATAEDGWSYEIGFNPSVSSLDFEIFDSHAWQWDARLALQFEPSDVTVFKLGILHWDRSRHYILPYGGVIHRPAENWEFQLMFPRSQISYLWRYAERELHTYLAAEFKIDAYAVDPTESTIGQYSDIRFLAGISKPLGTHALYVECGVATGRRFRDSESNDTDTIDSTFVVQGGLKY